MAQPYYKDGATQRTLTELYYQDGGTKRTITEGWIGDGGTKRQFYASTPSVAVNVSNHTIEGFAWTEENPSPPPAEIKNNGLALFQVNQDGLLYWEITDDGSGTGATAGGSYAGEWLSAGAAGDIEHRVTLLSGTATETGSTRNLWTTCGLTRAYGISVPFTGTPKTNVYLVEFRKASDSSALGSCQITLTVS